MQQLLLIIHILISFAIVALVLLQQGKGSDMGAAFGSGASNTMFGSQGATPFLVKLIGGLAILFFLTSLGLNYFVDRHPSETVDVSDVQTTLIPPANPAEVPGQAPDKSP